MRAAWTQSHHSIPRWQRRPSLLSHWFSRRRRCARGGRPRGLTGKEAIAAAVARDPQSVRLKLLVNAQPDRSVLEGSIPLDLPPLAVLAKSPVVIGIRHIAPRSFCEMQ